MENQVPPQGYPSKTTRSTLLERAKEAPTSPGVYLMRDASGAILYVGKAKSLRNRVITYFQPARHEQARIEMLVMAVDHFEVILTETEAEALILECTLIKRHKPKFNIRLKDDKSYPYIRIQVEQAYPRLEWTRRVRRDGSRYFGPFPSGWAAKQILRLLNETLRLRDCSENTFRHRSRPCILYQMEKCSAPCVGHVSTAEYAESIGHAVQILEGRSGELVSALERGMRDSAERLEYEQAAYYRDQLQNLELVTQTQGVLDTQTDRDRDVYGLAREESDAVGVVLVVRKGKLLSVKHYHLQNTDASLSEREVLLNFVVQNVLESAQIEEESYTRAQEVLLPETPEDLETLEKVLAQSGISVRTSASESDRQLLNVAFANAKHALELARKRAAGHGSHALQEIMEKLDLERLPSRIECYDISNIQGSDPVGSRVVFINGAPDKNLYRRYKIQTVQGQNDFAMMKEILGRRFQHADDPFPDLLVVDGGKGQLAQASAILEELNVQAVEVVGLAKARTESDFRKKEVESSMERIFIPGRKNPVALLPHTEAYKLLTHVRDEAHRFAVSYHRLLRSKRTIKKGD